jgi:IclR family acetate operon transcriptional repressor
MYSAMKNKPAYAISSVDHALHLAQLLQQEGSLSVSEAAELLGVARSTAHRLLAMLVYRDVAEQGNDRRYRPGPVLGPVPTSSTIAFRRAAVPYMQLLADRVNETVSLQVRVGTDVRFVESVECQQLLRVGDRAGKVFPAHHVAGGKALLAALSPHEVAALYEGQDIDLRRLQKQLVLVKKCGYAINNQETEVGVTAVGVAVLGEDGQPIGGLSLGVPSARFARKDLPGYVGHLNATAQAVSRELRSREASRSC